MVNRRDFLESFAIGTLLATRGPGSSGAITGRDPTGWYDRPMRWAQLAFVEDDPGNYDPGFWLDFFRRIHADAACLSAGGCVAFYPTQIPLHYRSKWSAIRQAIFLILSAASRGLLNPLPAPGRRLEGIPEILRFVDDLAVAELHFIYLVE